MGLTSAGFAKFGKLLTDSLVSAFPHTCTIGGVSYSCAWVPGPKGREAVVNGQVVRLEGALRIPFTALAEGTPPAQRALVTIGGVNYRIEMVTTRTHEGSHYLDLSQAGR